MNSEQPLLGMNAEGVVKALIPPAVWPHLSDGAEQLSVAEDDHQERHDEAEDKQADDVGYVVGCLGPPVH